MKLYTLIFLSCGALTSFAQSGFEFSKLSAEGRSILKRIETYESVPADTLGIKFEFLPKDYPQSVLRERVPIVELKELTNHHNPIIRCYAFKALTMVSEPEAFSVLKKHFQDTVVISTHHGCFKSDEFVGDFFINVYRGPEAILHDSSHAKVLDSLLIFLPNKLNARSTAMQRMVPNEKYYQRIRAIVIKEKNFGALIGLAKFEKVQDIELIMTTTVKAEWLYTRLSHLANFQAIRQFRHPAFLPFLTNHLERIVTTFPDNDCGFLYLIISEYENKSAHELLSRPFQITDDQIRSKHLLELSKVLKRNSNPIYNDLRQRLEAEVSK